MMIRYGTLGYDAVRRLGFVSGLRLGPERLQQSDLMIVSDEVDPTNLLWGFSRSRHSFKNLSGKNDEGVI